MARIDLPGPSELTPKQREVYDFFPSNLISGILTADPSIAAGYLGVGAGIAMSPLDPTLRELAILRVSTLTDCEYEWFQHIGRAREAGASGQEVAAVKTGDFATLDPVRSIGLRYVDECVTNVRVPRQTFDAARAALGDANLVTLTMLVGHYMETARFVENFEIDLDEAPGDWSALGSLSDA
jgi:4-carboxymuconolactone decarboxylase